jgi:hypothetical protein
MISEVTAYKAEIESLNERLTQSEASHNATIVSLAKVMEQRKQEAEKLIAAEKLLADKPSRQLSPARNEKHPNEGRGRSRSPWNGVAVTRGLTNGGLLSNGSADGEGLMKGLLMVRRPNLEERSLVQQSTPYVSMLGVVILGVGLMAALNAWQKGDRWFSGGAGFWWMFRNATHVFPSTAFSVSRDMAFLQPFLYDHGEMASHAFLISIIPISMFPLYTSLPSTLGGPFSPFSFIFRLSGSVRYRKPISLL